MSYKYFPKIRKSKFDNFTRPSKVAKAIASVSKIPLNPIQRKQVLKLAQTDEEVKEYDQYIPQIFYFGTTAQANLTVRPMLNMAQALGDNARVGDELKLKSIMLRMSFYNNYGAGSNPSNSARLIIFQYTANTQIPDMTQMFTGGTAVNIFSHLNTDHKDIYHLLYDRTFRTNGAFGAIGTQSSPDTLSRNLVLKVPLKYAKKRIQYLNATVNTTNQIYFAVLGEYGSNTLNPYLTCAYQVKYTDS